VIPLLAVAGSLVQKKRVALSAGSVPTHSPQFVGLLAGVVLIMGGLAYFPAVALGPVTEQVAMNPVSTIRLRNHHRARHPRDLIGVNSSQLKNLYGSFIREAADASRILMRGGALDFPAIPNSGPANGRVRAA
jgi:hypothetical protein